MTKDINSSSDLGDSADSKDSSGIHPRSRILTAALDLFVEQGYFNTNVPDISKKSKCSVGSIYHHFLNKEEIASSLYFDGINQFREALSLSINDSDNLEKNIRSMVKTFLMFAETHPTLSQYLWLARHNEFLTGKVGVPTTVGFDLLGRKLTKAIKGAIRKKEISAVRADILWTIVFGVPLSYVRDWLDGHTSGTPSQAADILGSACWGALQSSKK